MYVIEVAHSWACDTCGIKSPSHSTEPELRKALFEAGWISVEFCEELIPNGLEPWFVDAHHFCPEHAKERLSAQCDTQRQGPGHSGQDGV